MSDKNLNAKEKPKDNSYAPIGRKKYWIAVIIIFVASTVLDGIAYIVTGDGHNWVSNFVYVAELAFLAMFQIKRLHDANKPAGFALFDLIPFIGPLVITIVIGCLKPNHENNKWL